MIVYFARHGESEANVLEVFSNRGHKHPLTERGIQQVKELIQHLQPFQISKIYTSPLLRAVQTAKIIGKDLAIPITITPGLGEFDCGMFEDQPFTATAVEILQSVMSRWVSGEKTARIDGGESLEEIEDRFFGLIKKIIAEHSQDDRLLFVAHGGLYRAVFPALFDNISAELALQLRIGNAEYLTGEYKDNRWRCLLEN